MGDADIWTRYWRAGALHSCGCAYSGNYAGAVARFWERQFAGLDDGARIVDLGTGNGAIPLLARQYALAAGRSFAIHGVDLADIDPAAPDPQAFAGIAFHPRTSATALPFEARSVDLVTGQYAFEYLPREAALAELARVLAPQGRAAFVLHASDSEIAGTTREQLDHCRLLFDEVDLFGAVAELAALLAEAPDAEARRALAADPAAVAARDRVNAAAQAVSSRIAEATTPDMLQLALGHCSEALRQAHAWGAARVRAELDQARRALIDERRRLQDLDAAALDRQGIEALADALRGIGLAHIDIDRLVHEQGALLGWSLGAAR